MCANCTNLRGEILHVLGSAIHAGVEVGHRSTLVVLGRKRLRLAGLTLGQQLHHFGLLLGIEVAHVHQAGALQHLLRDSGACGALIDLPNKPRKAVPNLGCPTFAALHLQQGIG
jgi:hypothetical protein